MYSFAIELSSQKKKDGTHSLLLRITRERKHKRVSTGYCIKKEQFSHTSNLGAWVVNHPEAAELNSKLSQLITEIGVAVEEKRRTLKTITLDTLALWVKNCDEECFVQYAEKEVLKYNESDNSYRTYVRYASAISKLKEYRDGEALFFHELTPRLLKSYRIYLQGLGNSETTIYADLSCIRVMVNKAIRDNYLPIQDNPFLKLNFKAPKKSGLIYLTKEEVSVIENYSAQEGSKEALAIQCFLFAMYMGGLKFSEVCCLKWLGVLNGKLIIESHKKGGQSGGLVSLKLHEKAHEIIRKYQQKTWGPEDYIFPLLSAKKDLSSDEKLKKQISSKNSSINKLLKGVLKHLNIDKEITFFTARHTFAFLASQKTDDIGVLSVVLGHTDVGQTELYLKQINNTQEDDLLLNTFY